MEVSPSWQKRLVDAGLSLGALLAWELRFGALGPDFNTDVAVHGAMILRPVDGSFIYYWGQGRLGSVVPAIGKLVAALSGMGADESAQLAVYLCNAGALFIALGMLRRLGPKLLFFAICAFPSTILAESVLTAGQHAPGLFLLSLVEVRTLLALLAAANPLRAVGLGLSAGGVIWAGEPGLFLLLGQVPVLVRFVRRLPSPDRLVILGLALLGGIVPLLLILRGKQLGPESATFHHLLQPRELAHNLAHLDASLRPLFPLLGGVGLLLMAVAAAAGWVWAFRQGELSPILAVCLAPVLGLLGVAATRYFEVNDHAPRYLVSSVLLTWLTLALLLDVALEATAPKWWQRLALAAVVVLAVVVAGEGRRANDRLKDSGVRWRERTQWVESIGCRSVIGSYWNSYPYFTMSDGRVLATPREGDFVRQETLALESVRSSLVCAIPWWKDATCPATLEQFGQRLSLQDELVGPLVAASHPGESPLRVCRYTPAD